MPVSYLYAHARLQANKWALWDVALLPFQEFSASSYSLEFSFLGLQVLGCCCKHCWVCRSIRGIASRFNLVDELTVALSGLVLQAKQLTSVNARQTADKDIARLQSFITQLSSEGTVHTLIFGSVP